MTDHIQDAADALTAAGRAAPSVERDSSSPPTVDNLLAARATRANLEGLGPDAYLQNAPTLIAEAQLDATIALAEATRALALVQMDEFFAARSIGTRWAEWQHKTGAFG